MNARHATRPASPKQSGGSSEAPIADFLTVCWMLAVMTALLCELGAGIAALVLAQRPDSRPLQALVDILLFAALIVGVAAVGFMPILWRVRKAPPPTPIAWFAVGVGLAPVVFLLARLAR